MRWQACFDKNENILKIIAFIFAQYEYTLYIYNIIIIQKDTTMKKFNEVTEKLNKMFKGQSETKKDELVKNLKRWCKLNANTEDTGKLDAIKCFLADNNIF